MSRRQYAATPETLIRAMAVAKWPTARWMSIVLKNTSAGTVAKLLVIITEC